MYKNGDRVTLNCRVINVAGQGHDDNVTLLAGGDHFELSQSHLSRMHEAEEAADVVFSTDLPPIPVEVETFIAEGNPNTQEAAEPPAA